MVLLPFGLLRLGHLPPFWAIILSFRSLLTLFVLLDSLSLSLSVSVSLGVLSLFRTLTFLVVLLHSLIATLFIHS